MSFAPTTRARLHATVAVLGAGLLAWRTGQGWALALAGVAASLALLAWASPRAYVPIQRGVDRALHAFLASLTWLLLLLVFGGLIIPLRLWSALARRDPLALRPRAAVATYLRSLPPRGPHHFERQF